MRRKRKEEFVVIGLGRFGSSLAIALEAAGHHVLGIDTRPKLVQKYSNVLTHVVSLDATDEDALRAVDIMAFETVVVAIGTDFEASVLATSALKNLGIANVYCKTTSRRQADILRRVGADRVVQPEADAGRRLAEDLLAPTVLERFHLDPSYSIAELTVPHSLVCLSLAQSNIRARYGISVLVIKRGSQLMTSPAPDTILLEGDMLVILGKDEEIETFSQLR